jgi:predicted transcriptional regulator
MHLSVIVIEPTPGKTTAERILELLQEHEQGMTIKQLSSTLNRSVSMVQRCLKILMADGLVYARLKAGGMQLIYYPISTPR